MPDPEHSSPIPADSLIFGYGPMLPFIPAAGGAWTLDDQWSAAVTVLGIVWGAMILVFVGGVRRGFEFGRSTASLSAAIIAMLIYFVLGGSALVTLIFVSPLAAIAILIAGFMIVPIADAHAARYGNASDYFSSLRPSQMAIATLALIALIAHALTVAGHAGSTLSR